MQLIRILSINSKNHLIVKNGGIFLFITLIIELSSLTIIC